MTGCADAILAAVRREIELRRAIIDASSDLGEVTITIRLQAGTSWVRGLIWEEERVYRRVGPQIKEARDSMKP